MATAGLCADVRIAGTAASHKCGSLLHIVHRVK